jgi:tRNA pseudouridine55 synthase
MIQPSGVFLLNKRAGFSSAQAIALLKRRLGIKKIGHAGTLDPFATGLLVCLVNSATKLADSIQAGVKTYSGVIRLGITTDSDDITGAIISESDSIPSADAVIACAGTFRGKFQQVPPRVSAIKISGQRAYDMQRKGQQFELQARETEVYSSSFEMLDAQNLRFELCCAKGFYVRSFARDLGEKLGCGATLAVLQREASLPFALSQAKFVDQLEWQDLIDPASFQERRVV